MNAQTNCFWFLFIVLVFITVTNFSSAQTKSADLVGTWKITKFEDDGRDRLGRLGVSAKPKKGKKASFAKLIISEKECWVIRGDGKREVKQGLSNCAWKSFQLDANKPHHIDITGMAGKDGKRTRVYPAIFEFKGNTLKICWPESGSKRPTTLESNGAMNLFVCERLSRKPEIKPKNK